MQLKENVKCTRNSPDAGCSSDHGPSSNELANLQVCLSTSSVNLLANAECSQNSVQNSGENSIAIHDSQVSINSVNLLANGEYSQNSIQCFNDAKSANELKTNSANLLANSGNSCQKENSQNSSLCSSDKSSHEQNSTKSINLLANSGNSLQTENSQNSTDECWDDDTDANSISLLDLELTQELEIGRVTKIKVLKNLNFKFILIQ